MINRTLSDKNIHIEEGDIIEWDNEYYEVDTVGGSQYWTGRNPSTDIGFTEGDIAEHGYSVAISVEAHVTRRNRLNIQEVRSGINKTSTSNSVFNNTLTPRMIFIICFN